MVLASSVRNMDECLVLVFGLYGEISVPWFHLSHSLVANCMWCSGYHGGVLIPGEVTEILLIDSTSMTH